MAVNYFELLDSWIADRRVQAAGEGVEIPPPAFSFARQVALQNYRRIFMRDMAPVSAHEEALAAVSTTHPLPSELVTEEDAPVHYGRTDWTYKMPTHRQGLMELELVGDLDEATGGRLAGQLRQAVADPRTESILINVASNGGLLIAAYGVVLEMERARQKGVPLVAFIAERAASAAAVIAMAADEVIVADDTGYGLPGSIMVHRPWGASEASCQDGQEEIARIVARCRGESEARINELLASKLDHEYFGADCISEGFADALGSIWDARGRAISRGKAVRQ